MMEWEPGVRDVVENEAEPENRVAVARVGLPSVNTTVPVAAAGETVAVSVNQPSGKDGEGRGGEGGRGGSWIDYNSR